MPWKKSAAWLSTRATSTFFGVLEADILASPHAYARIRSIDVSRASRWKAWLLW